MTPTPTEATVTVPVTGAVVTIEKYTFKPFAEAAFAGATAVGILAFELAVDFDPQAVLTDPYVYGLMVVGAAVRSFGAAGLNVLVRLLAKQVS
jgi:energy-converting hydrogenase Eha subunit H